MASDVPEAPGMSLSRRVIALARRWLRARVDELKASPEVARRLSAAAHRRGGPPGAIAIFHVHRCGSQVLGKMLGAHPALDWLGEIHNPRGPDPRLWWWLAGVDRRATVPRALPAFRDLAGSKRPVLSVPSSVAAMDAVPPAELVRRLIAAGVTHAVILERRNLLNVLVSLARARTEGVWHRRNSDPEPPSRTCEVPLRSPHGGFPGLDIGQTLQAMRAWYTEVRTALSPVASLSLIYEEDLEHDPSRGLSRVFAFLGLPDLPVQPTLRKASRVPLADLIENIDAVRERLSGTSEEWMLDKGV